MQKFPMTAEGLAKLEEELKQLKAEERPAVIRSIAEARAHGDLSENAEYHAAREQQGLQEARVRQLRQMIENAEIIETADDGVVRPGMIVTLRYEGEDPETYLFGLREEKGGEFPVLTPDSPLGQALTGHGAGETVTTKVPAGDLKIEIVEVRAP